MCVCVYLCVSLVHEGMRMQMCMINCDDPVRGWFRGSRDVASVRQNPCRARTKVVLVKVVS